MPGNTANGLSETAALTCWSCANWRRDTCILRWPGFPTTPLTQCTKASYEPGADEAERDDNDNSDRGRA